MLRWRAILDDGSILTEGEGHFVVVEGESLPWRKLGEFINQSGSSLAAIEIDNNGRKTTIPASFSRFNLGSFEIHPQAYAVQYCVELRDVLNGGVQEEYVDVIGLFKEYRVHYISSENESYIVVTKGDEPMVPIPSIFYDPDNE